MIINEITNAVTDYKASSPGKLILSGEHSVVYGAPALAAAIDRHTTVTFTPALQSEGLRTAFHNFTHSQFYPLDLLKSFKQGLDKRFNAFKYGDISVRDILTRPDDLAVYSVATLLNYLPMPAIQGKHAMPSPGILGSESTIPTGAGMGSSAAVIAATFVLYEYLLGHVQSEDERCERVRFCERLQHGQGSAIDAASVVYGGINRVENGEITHLSKTGDISSIGDNWYWIFHGKPQSSTGECVTHVANKHAQDSNLWQNFENCTNALQKALSHGASPIEALKENHRLLTHIGVVPDTAQTLIQNIERQGGAAKISGAGAVQGNNAGIILVNIPEEAQIAELMKNYPGMEWSKLSVANSGAHLLTEGLEDDAPHNFPLET